MAQKTILIADDETRLLHALSCRLESEGFRVIATQDGYQALALARRELPDMLLLDISMPAGDGFSVHQRITQINELRGCPVIYITGMDSPKVYELAEQLGAAAIVHKPFETSELMDAIWSHIDTAPHGLGA